MIIAPATGTYKMQLVAIDFSKLSRVSMFFIHFFTVGGTNKGSQWNASPPFHHHNTTDQLDATCGLIWLLVLMNITIQRAPVRLENIKRFESLWKNKLPWTILEKTGSQCQKILLQVKEAMTSFRCYDNYDVNTVLLITNVQSVWFTKPTVMFFAIPLLMAT